MRLVTYKRRNERRAGLVIDNLVYDIAGTSKRLNLNLPCDVLSILEMGEGGVRKLRRLEKLAPRSARGKPLSQVRLCAPVPNPRKVFCLAGNYTEHIAEAGKEVDESKFVTPRVFMKPSTTTVCGHGDPIIISRKAQKIDWEIELAVVIGKKGKYIKRREALDYVAGFTVFNDVSERALLIRKRPQTEEWDSFFDWLNGKWMDNFAPMGPVLVLRDELPNPSNLRLTLKLNHKVMQDANTAQMIFDVPNIIEYISAILTLEPGDIIATGTPSGVGFAHGIFLKPGDVVEASIEKIGTLRNKVIKEKK